MMTSSGIKKNTNTLIYTTLFLSPLTWPSPIRKEEGGEGGEGWRGGNFGSYNFEFMYCIIVLPRKSLVKQNCNTRKN